MVQYIAAERLSGVAPSQSIDQINVSSMHKMEYTFVSKQIYNWKNLTRGAFSIPNI